MKFPVIIYTATLIISSFSACYYDSEEDLYPPADNGCDTTQVTFAMSVIPILEDNCYACHSNANAALSGNVRLEEYNDVMIQVTNGNLLGSITHSTGFLPMPQGAPRLDDCRIAIIQQWIESGSPDN